MKSSLQWVKGKDRPIPREEVEDIRRSLENPQQTYGGPWLEWLRARLALEPPDFLTEASGGVEVAQLSSGDSFSIPANTTEIIPWVDFWRTSSETFATTLTLGGAENNASGDKYLRLKQLGLYHVQATAWWAAGAYNRNIELGVNNSSLPVTTIATSAQATTSTDLQGVDNLTTVDHLYVLAEDFAFANDVLLYAWNGDSVARAIRFASLVVVRHPLGIGTFTQVY